MPPSSRRLGAPRPASLPKPTAADGAANVALYRVAAHVQLAESGEAIAAAEAIPDRTRTQLPRERRAHHLADLARAYTQAGQREQAVDTLLDAEREAPQEVRCRPRSATSGSASPSRPAGPSARRRPAASPARNSPA